MSLYPRRILLATDGSEKAELAAGVAVELAKSTGAELHLVHVKLIPITLPYPEVLDWKEDLERAEREARELLDEQVKMVEGVGGTVVGVHLREEEPAEEIVALAEELGVSLIVVGSRHRGRIRRALAGRWPGASPTESFATPPVPSWWCARTRAPTTVHVYREEHGGTWTARSEASKEASARR